MEAVYEIRSLKHAYRGQTVLVVDHLAVKPASIVGLAGPNGSGKSTLLRLMGLIERPVEGEILYNGRPVAPFTREARLQITLLPQEPFLMRRSVFGNVAYGLKLRGDVGNLGGRVKEALSMVGLSSEIFCRRPWYALSGGEAQRVALAARLVLRPSVLLLDEPTAGVDAASAQLIREASLRIRQELGTTLVVASHDRQWLYEICDEMLHLFRGRVFEKGHENIVFGPWMKLDSGLWGKKLSDSQFIRVPAPPNDEAGAVMDGLALSLAGEAPTLDGHVVGLQGTVTRFNLDKSAGRVLVTVLVENHNFTVTLTPQQVEERMVFPGKVVDIRYDPDRIRWI